MVLRFYWRHKCRVTFFAMKKILPILSILILTLTSCGTLEVTLETQPTYTPAPTASFAGTAAPPPLSLASTSAQIRQTLLDSPFRWRTIFMDAQVTRTGESVRYQVWVDQPSPSALCTCSEYSRMGVMSSRI